jgi:DNA-binding MarR family transcriptional regulator
MRRRDEAFGGGGGDGMLSGREEAEFGGHRRGSLWLTAASGTGRLGIVAAMDDLTTVLDLARASATLVTRVERALGSWHGVGFDDLGLLLALLDAPDGRLPVSELAAVGGSTPAAVVRRLGPLERIGVIARDRDAEDPRRSTVRLTEAGATLASDAGATADEVARAALHEHWTPSQLEALREVLAPGHTVGRA